MKLFSASLIIFVLSMSVWAQSVPENPGNPPEPPMLGPHWARGANPNQGASTSPNMTWHGGPILQSATTAAIFWGTSWSNCISPACDKISGMDSWYGGVGSNFSAVPPVYSPYAQTDDEYCVSSTCASGTVGSSITYNGHHVDTSAAPNHAPRTSQVLSEVCKEITSPVTNGYYAVYVDTKRGGANYCAWHSWGSCNGTSIQFAFFFNLDGDPGCDPQSTVPNQSQGLQALANVSGHELSEARTDPRGSAWYDSSGNENADKCAWSFGSADVMFSNGTAWKIQGNWSNYAYSNGGGYANLSGQNGCIDGGNYPQKDRSAAP
jgi:hypothetical protein